METTTHNQIAEALIQGSEEWLQWRAQHIGASEVPSIMGTNDFGSALSLWMEKTGQKERFKGNFATQRGNELEPIVRDIFERRYECKSPPIVLEYKEWPVLSASLDGLIDGKAVVEIKCPSLAKHQQAINGEVPATYRDQLQAQLLVSGLSTAFYVSFHTDDKNEIAVVVVKEDKIRQQQILNRAKEFWNCIQTNTPPDLIPIQPEILKEIKELEDVKTKIKELEEIKNNLEKHIQNEMKGDKILSGEYIVSWSERIGSINYKAIPELIGIDLEKFRNKQSRVFSIKKFKQE